MMIEPTYRSILGGILVIIIISISLPFEKRYSRTMAHFASEPATRLVAGLAVLWLAHHDIVLGALGFIALFLWVSDIHLLSHIHIGK